MSITPPHAEQLGRRARAYLSYSACTVLFTVFAVLAYPRSSFAGPDGYRDRATDSEKTDKDDSKPKDFSIEFNLPYFYSSNVVSASSDSILEKKGDFHTVPELYFKWSHQYDSVKASADVGVSIDRYNEAKDGDINALASSFKVAKTDGTHEAFVPYALVANSIYFDPAAGNTTGIVYYDVAGGFYSGFAWRDQQSIPYIDSMIPYSEAYKGGDASVLFDLRIGRRITDQLDYQFNFVTAKFEVAYYFTENFRIEYGPTFKARWYDNYFGDKRVDYRPGAKVDFYWKPDWLKALSKRSELSLSFNFSRNYSNLSDKNYSLWELGPTLSLRTKF